MDRDLPASTTTLREVFASNVEHCVRGRGLGRARLARLAGLSRSHTQAVLTARRSVGIDRAARVAWALEAPCADLVDRDVRPPLTCMSRDTPEDLRWVLAANIRALALEAHGEICVATLAKIVGWHRSRVYGVLKREVDLSIDKLEPLAKGLGTTPAGLLRPRPERSR